MANFDAINDILKEYYDSSFYYGGNIPSKKLTNAFVTYVPTTAKVHALYDATIFGSAKEGACFTQDTIYFRSGKVSSSVKYDAILAAPIGEKTLGGTYCGSLYIWFPKLMENIKKSNDPVDLTEANESIANGSYEQAIRALDKQEKYLRNTPIDDVVVYKYLYIEAYANCRNYCR